MRRIDITGRRFGHLVVIEYTGDSKWLCRCDCGNEKEIDGISVRRGATVSCGCYRYSEEWKGHTKHGSCHSRLNGVWRNLKQRCNNPNNPSYKYYGGRGVRVCDEWADDYGAFRDWAYANGYDPDAPLMQCTIDRIDPGGDYCPENCRWVDASVQASNKRPYRNPSSFTAVDLIDNEGNTLETYPSMRDAAESTGCKVGDISATCRGKQKSTHGMRWRYSDPSSVRHRVR